jgi:hypothetical protein
MGKIGDGKGKPKARLRGERMYIILALGANFSLLAPPLPPLRFEVTNKCQPGEIKES